MKILISLLLVWDRDITYEKLAKACLAVRNGATFISTNGDIAIPTERGLLPGNGSLTSVVAVSTGVDQSLSENQNQSLWNKL